MMLPMEKEPDTTAAAKARLVPPLKFAAVHCCGDRILARWDVLEEEICLSGEEGVKGTYGVENGQGGDDGVHEVDSCEAAGAV